MKCELVVPDHVPSGPRSILLKILQQDPELRPSASELYCDSWVQGINQHGGGSVGDAKSGRSFSTQPPLNSTAMQIGSSPMTYQVHGTAHQAILNQTQQHYGRAGQPSADARATTANDGNARNKDRMRNSQLQ